MLPQSKLKNKKEMKIEPIIQIKNEAEELHPLSYYIDDRVDLVKQIFAALKPKTIKSLAPEFLKKSTIEEIEELCLNELLGISTKRLNSIINATTCPSDTETSSDSDVNNIEEHISLEEISSDSGTEGKSKRRVSAKRSRRNAVQKPTTNENGKEFSVLELLELQARARAIRSQLALEPVTKIEVDSDNSTDSENTASSHQNSLPNISAQKLQNELVAKTNGECSSSLKTLISVNGNVDKSNSSSSSPPTKRIKLKRNFRKQQKSGSENENENENSNQQSDNKNDENDQDVENKEESMVSTEKEERSSSPDVITIVQSPETLCISDSSDDEKVKNTGIMLNGNKSTANENSEKIITENIDDKEKSSKEINENFELVDKLINDSKKPIEDENSKESAIVVQQEEEKEPEEPEDGEIFDDDEDENPQEIISIEEQNESLENNDDNTVENDENDEKTEKNIDIEEETKSEEKIDQNVNVSGEVCPSNETTNLDCENEQRNDDVISLGNEDLDYEMRDQSEEDAQKLNKLQLTNEEESLNSEKPEVEKMDSIEGIDFIDLHDDSSDEQMEEEIDLQKSKETQSWNSRWLTSKKVTKILATSRLGNRVRDKIKNAKKTEQQTSTSQSESDVSAQNSPKVVFESKFEDGSIEQYKEILDRKDST